MKKALPADWIRSIKKHIDRLESAECFGDFLLLGLGRPEQLKDNNKIRYSIHISPNVRLILGIEGDRENVRSCTEIKVEGVCDYHGGKENWYIP